MVSAKTGEGIEEELLREEIVERLPSPKENSK